tara:strand:- start:6 stop:233 length:228 start_codon:yes stop_codon:yes gene_type:complete
MNWYRIVVGNIGTVTETTDYAEARGVYVHYINQSRDYITRAAGESVYFFSDNELTGEFTGGPLGEESPAVPVVSR